MENSRRCDVCSIIIHGASYAKHLTNKKHLDNKGQDELIVPEWLFKED